jgi:hypothetical protein
VIVYNITIKIESQIEKEWVSWQKQEHIPEILATGLFNDGRLFRLLNQEEEEGITYVVQYFTSSLEKYNCYIEKHASKLRKKANEKWGQQFVAFRTLMQLVE